MKLIEQRAQQGEWADEFFSIDVFSDGEQEIEIWFSPFQAVARGDVDEICILCDGSYEYDGTLEGAIQQVADWDEPVILNWLMEARGKD